MEANTWVSEEPFELKGDTAIVNDGPLRARLAYRSSNVSTIYQGYLRYKGKLFSKCTILLKGTFNSLHASDCKELVQLGGGKVFDSTAGCESEDKNGQDDPIEVVVCGLETKLDEIAELRSGYPTLELISATWVLDCASAQTLLERSLYKI